MLFAFVCDRRTCGLELRFVEAGSEDVVEVEGWFGGEGFGGQVGFDDREESAFFVAVGEGLREEGF